MRTIVDNFYNGLVLGLPMKYENTDFKALLNDKEIDLATLQQQMKNKVLSVVTYNELDNICQLSGFIDNRTAFYDTLLIENGKVQLYLKKYQVTEVKQYEQPKPAYQTHDGKDRPSRMQSNNKDMRSERKADTSAYKKQSSIYPEYKTETQITTSSEILIEIDGNEQKSYQQPPKRETSKHQQIDITIEAPKAKSIFAGIRK